MYASGTIAKTGSRADDRAVVRIAIAGRLLGRASPLSRCATTSLERPVALLQRKDEVWWGG